MVPAELKAEFGSRLCFSGGVDEQELLPRGTPEQVAQGVRELIDVMAPGGGYFLGPTHNFQADIPTANILAMYEAALEY
jgi:uroporphyrinogen decarboxylase